MDDESLIEQFLNKKKKLKKIIYYLEKELDQINKEELYIYLKELLDMESTGQLKTNSNEGGFQKQLLSQKSREDVDINLKDIFFNKIEKKADIPEYLLCNISLDLMNKPVTLESGMTYEECMISTHLEKNGLTDPVTRESLKRARYPYNLLLLEQYKTSINFKIKIIFSGFNINLRTLIILIN